MPNAQLGIQMVQGVLTLSQQHWPQLLEFQQAENELAYAALSDWMQHKMPSVCWLTGEPSSGKTHLAQAWISTLSAQGQVCAYLNGREAVKQSVAVLQGLDRLDLVCIDDVQYLLAQADWLAALSHLHRLMQDSAGALLLIQRASIPTVDWPAQMVSLRVIQSLAVRKGILMARANKQGMQLPDVLVNWLMKTYDNDLGQLLHVLDYLDKASLTLKRPLTLPFAKQVLLFS